MDKQLRQLTVVVPAFNEQDKIEKTITEIIDAAKDANLLFEVIVVDDGSSDGTLNVAMRMAELYKQVRVIPLPENRGVGNAFLVGLTNASYKYISLVPGDNAYAQSGVNRLFREVGKEDLIISYRSNPAARTFLRRQLSRLATNILRLLSGKSVRDAHSLFVYPAATVKAMQFSTGYGYHMETLIRLLLITKEFLEVPVELNPKPDASSGVMKIRTQKWPHAVGQFFRIYKWVLQG